MQWKSNLLSTFQVRWRAAKGPARNAWRDTCLLLRRDATGPLLIALLLGILPAVLSQYALFVQLTQGLAYGTPISTQPLSRLDMVLLIGGGRGAYSGRSTLLGQAVALVFIPWLLSALSRTNLARLHRSPLGPMEAIRGCIKDWQSILMTSFVLTFATQILAFVPDLLSLLLGLIASLLSIIPGLGTPAVVVVAVVTAVFSLGFSFLVSVATGVIYLTLARDRRLGLAQGIQALTRAWTAVGTLLRVQLRFLGIMLALVCGLCLVWALVPVLPLLPLLLIMAVLSPLMQVPACAATAVILAESGPGPSSAFTPPDHLAHMKSANIPDN